MDLFAAPQFAEPPDELRLRRLTELAPRPRSVSETGLSESFLYELVAKHMYDGGIMDVRELGLRAALAGPVIEEILNLLRRDGHVEVRGSNSGGLLRYALTDRGRVLALEALAKSGYLGRAPVPLEAYVKLVRAQSVHRHRITRNDMQRAYEDVVATDTLLDELGSALHSARAIFVYGPPGSGKTYMCQRLARVLGDSVLIPHAVCVGNTPVQVFDPLIHHSVVDMDSTLGHRLEDGVDPRFLIAERPAVVTGGELTLGMLEISYDPSTRIHVAPLQMKAINGVYMIDDLGRQRVAPVDLFNRWIVPLENGQDYLTLASGKRFPVPFDIILVFSTNLNPHDLADDAFLRRIGHKIRFDYLDPEHYSRIWQQVCKERDIPFDAAVLRYALDELHRKREVPLLACQPRDLLGMALDQARYLRDDNRVTVRMLETAWRNYFVDLGNADPTPL